MSELPEKQIKRLRSLISEAETNLAAAKELLNSVLGDGAVISVPSDSIVSTPEGKIIEGIFDGQIMIGPDGKNYPVPANYASKSKLVEGDIMKLKSSDKLVKVARESIHCNVLAICVFAAAVAPVIVDDASGLVL